ncbi:MAG: VOC family protein [Ardenticatenaceae bacterium]|nr:VOC family protein [Ardenticatenaceae bacterium]
MSFSHGRLVALHPVLPVRDVSKSVEFYQKLGFESLFQDNPQEPRYAGLQRDGIELHVQWHEPEGFAENVDRINLRIVVENIETLFTEFEPAGVFHEQTALRDTAWGTREFAFYDPDGNGLTFYRDL